MSMSRRDFELLARVLKDVRHNTSDDKNDTVIVDHIAKRIAEALSSHSSTFQPERFLEACKPKEKK